MLRLLIIDDNPGDRLLALRELHQSYPDLQAQEVGEPDELTAALAAGNFDLVVTDYQVHWSNGLEILQAIKARYPDCPVVMFTNSGSEEIAVQGMKLGLSDYVLKRKQLYRLTVAVQESLEKQRLRRDFAAMVERLQHSEEQLRQQAQQLMEANQLKDEFLAVLSHELRTPLNPILGWVQIIRQGNLTPDKLAYALASIERNARLQTQLIDDLLDISRMLRGKVHLERVSVDLVPLIEAALETVQVAAEAKQLRITTVLAPPGRFVSGDPGRLQQIIWNLLSNAVKFTPAEGAVEVQLRYVDATAQITIQDTGRGIDPDFLPQMFEYFRQADSSTTRNFGGLGLGLAIARNLTELHGGTIQAASSGNGQGATFTVTFPLLPPSTIHMDTPVLQNQNQQLTGIQVLAVDDDQDNLELLSFVLEDAGAVVTAVSSAPAVLQQLSDKRPDVLVCDIGMPEIDGYELLRQVRQSSVADLPAIALTAYAGEVNQQRALAAGFSHHLAKPVEPEQLIQTILALLQP